MYVCVRARTHERLPLCARAKMHVRMQPTVDDFESALSALIDHSVAVCEGIPAIEPHVLKPYSPFAPPEVALEREAPVPDAEVAADAAALSKAMYTEAVTCLKVVGGPPSTEYLQIIRMHLHESVLGMCPNPCAHLWCTHASTHSRMPVGPFVSRLRGPTSTSAA